MQVPAEAPEAGAAHRRGPRDEVWKQFPFVPGARPVVTDKIEDDS